MLPMTVLPIPGAEFCVTVLSVQEPLTRSTSNVPEVVRLPTNNLSVALLIVEPAGIGDRSNLIKVVAAPACTARVPLPPKLEFD
jgi:hypothetical protein